MKKATYELTNSLSQIDLKVLESIYLFRCLTIRQVYRNFYTDIIDSFETFQSTKLKELIEYEVVELQEFNRGNYALFLTSTGVEVVRYTFDLPTNIIDDKNKVVKRGYYRAGELKMLPRLINHQVHLNQFVLEFKKYADKRNIKWKHYGEKYVSQYVNIRPDGLIQFLDMDFFLEMDMNTESMKQLIEKWQNYRNFLTSREFRYNEKKIVVLFIIENATNIEKRKDLVRRSCSDILLDIFDSEFDIYIGTKDELMKLVFENLIPNALNSNWKQQEIKSILWQQFGFGATNGIKYKEQLNGSEYGYYICKMNKEGLVVRENGQLQEYLFDDYFFRPLSVLKKIAYLQRNSSMFKARNGRDISYIVLTEDENVMYHDLDIVDLVGVKNVYFTTLKRLENLPLHEALYEYDSLGNIHHFANSGLNKRIFERRIES